MIAAIILDAHDFLLLGRDSPENQLSAGMASEPVIVYRVREYTPLATVVTSSLFTLSLM